MTVFQYIRSDYSRHKKYGGTFIGIWFFTQGFWASFQYRICHYLHKKVRVWPFRPIVSLFIILWQKWVEILTGISIPPSAVIGHSLYIGHFGGIILNAQTVLGNNCNLSQGVTIGVSGLNESRGVPAIGDNVYFGANSVIAGNITIGNNVLIGACSFVSSSVPDNWVVGGVPAKMISEKGSEGYI